MRIRNVNLGIIIASLTMIILKWDIYFANHLDWNQISSNIILATLSGATILVICQFLFIRPNNIVLTNYPIFLLGGAIFAIGFDIENYYMIELNTLMTIDGVGLRIYTWNYMFIAAVVEEVLKAIYLVIAILLYRKTIPQLILLIGVGLLTFESISYLRLGPPFVTSYTLMLDRLIEGSFILHISTMLGFMLVYYITKLTTRKITIILLSLMILMTNIFVHLYFNYNTIMRYYGGEVLMDHTIIAWSYMVTISLLIYLVKYKST